MKQQITLIGGLIFCLGLVGFYGYLIFAGTQAKGQAATAAPRLTLDEKTLGEIRAKSLNGQLPLVLDRQTLGNPGLFSR